MTILIVDTGMLAIVKDRGIMATSDSIIPSRENSDIRKWWRWVRNVSTIA